MANRYNHVRLPIRFDLNQLVIDLNHVMEDGWNIQSPFSTEGVPGLTTTAYHEGSWKIISLRSLGGDDARTDPGGPALMDYSYTSRIKSAPYIKSILDKFSPYVRTARLSVLNPGDQINMHQDTFIAFKYGQVRLHIPIVTNRQAVLNINGETLHWSAGELWYGDFSKPHNASNRGDTPRIHLVFDVCLYEDLLDMFPSGLVDLAQDEGLLVQLNNYSSQQSGLDSFECKFLVSAALIKGVLEFDDGIPGEYLGEIKCLENSLIFILEKRPIARLVRVSEYEFRYMGWTMERVFKFGLNGQGVKNLCMRINSGRSSTIIELPLCKK